MVHPFTRPQQPGGGAAAAAAQRPVGQRSPQQPGGSGGESDASDCAALTLSVLDKMSIYSVSFSLQRKSILNPEAKEFVPGKKY